RLLVKLVRLVPKEYHNGVREGQIVVPLEYREAKDFIVQAQQLVNELSGAWRQANRKAYDRNGPALIEKMEQTEQQIVAKADPSMVRKASRESSCCSISGGAVSISKPLINAPSMQSKNRKRS